PRISNPGGTTEQFTVQYTDRNGISASTLGNSNIVVNGPNGFSAQATFVSATPAGNSSTVVATYQIAAPGGAWTLPTSGIYSITLLPGQVSNINGLAAAGGSLGTFVVDLPVVFGDANVAAAVSRALGKDSGAVLRVSDLASLTSLSL